MFKVICVRPLQFLVVGDTYTVLEVLPCNQGSGRKGYVLEEVDAPKPYDSFCSSYFAPCNGPDEVVLLEERTDAEIARLEADYQELLGEEFAVTPVDDAVVARIWHNIEAKLNL